MNIDEEKLNLKRMIAEELGIGTNAVLSIRIRDDNHGIDVSYVNDNGYIQKHNIVTPQITGLALHLIDLQRRRHEH